MSNFGDIFKMRVWALVRNIFSLIFGPSERVTEYRFVNKNLESEIKRVLDIGGANSNLAISLSKKGLLVDVIDVRKYSYKHKNLGVIKGDLIEHVFNHRYDGVVLVSTIEHIGLCVYGDPEYEDGDFKALDKVFQLLENEGVCMLTTHYVDIHHVKNGVRFYDEERLTELVKRFEVIKEEYYVPTRKILDYPLNWIRINKNEVLKKINREINDYALVCLILKKGS